MISDCSYLGYIKNFKKISRPRINGKITDHLLGKAITVFSDYYEGKVEDWRSRSDYFKRSPVVSKKLSELGCQAIVRSVARTFLGLCPTKEMFKLCLTFCWECGCDFAPGALDVIKYPVDFLAMEKSPDRITYQLKDLFLNIREEDRALRPYAFFGLLVPQVYKQILWDNCDDCLTSATDCYDTIIVPKSIAASCFNTILVPPNAVQTKFNYERIGSVENIIKACHSITFKTKVWSGEQIHLLKQHRNGLMLEKGICNAELNDVETLLGYNQLALPSLIPYSGKVRPTEIMPRNRFLKNGKRIV